MLNTGNVVVPEKVFVKAYWGNYIHIKPSLLIKEKNMSKEKIIHKKFKDVKELLQYADEVCPINPFIKYKNRTKNRIHKAISIFLFSLYYWFCLEKRDRDNLKKGNEMRIATPVYFVKNTVLTDIHFLKQKP